MSTIGSRWVNPDVSGESEKALQSQIMALLFATPLLASFHLAANLPPEATTALIVPMLALAFAMPVIAAATLSISGSPQIRNFIIALAGPIGFLAITGGRIGLAPVYYLVLAVCVAEASRSAATRKAWLISCGLLCLSAAVIALSAPFGAAVEASFAGLAPVATAAALFALARRKPDEAAPAQKMNMFEVANDLLAGTGALVIEVRRNGFVVNAGANASVLLSVNSVDLAGRGLVERVHVADKVEFLAWLDSLGIDAKSFRFRAGRAAPDGGPEWIQLNAAARQLDGSLLLTLSPITPAVSNLQMSEIPGGTALASVSHELRTPLNAIVGFSDMLKQEMFGPLGNDRQREYVGLIHASGLHLLDVVNAMLDWSRLESGSMQLACEPFAPTESAAMAVALVSPLATQKRIGLDFQPLAAFDEFSGDPRLCRQILINLLSNAVKFTPDGGMVRLTVDLVDGQLMLQVEDTGIGMTREQLGFAGTPFYQADSSYARGKEGAGLGLALVKQMAKLHGGSVEIDSVPGKGTKVAVALSPVQPKRANVTPLHRQQEDESVRIIRVFEERENGTQRKTA